MNRVRVRISFERHYRLRDDQPTAEALQDLTRLWKDHLGPDADNLKIEVLQEVEE